MNIEAMISNIYPEVNQLAMFPHQETGLTYHLLSHAQLVQLADWTLEILLGMGIDQVIVSESGAVPFAKICAWISVKKNLPFRWYSIKIPRELKENTQVTLQTYLSLAIEDLRLSHELNTEPTGYSFTVHSFASDLPSDYFDLQDRPLIEILETLSEGVHFSGYQQVLTLTHKTGLAQLLEKPFIFFDEYIDSGKTLFQSFRFFNLFRQSLQFKVFSYLIKLPKTVLNNTVCESLYTLDDEYQAYQWGVYPFENRIDWLGYFYTINPTLFRKVCISEFCAQYTAHDNYATTEFLEFLTLISQDEWLNEVKCHCAVLQVSTFITHKHLIQYSLYILEKTQVGTSEFSEFFYQLFDLYGPMWSPLPDHYHMSYLNAFENIAQKLIRIFSTESMGEKYQRVRTLVIQNVAQLLEKRRIHQQNTLLMTMEKKNEP